MGITFSQEPLDTLLHKAKEEGKLVFMDCYTSWCGPCKRLIIFYIPVDFFEHNHSGLYSSTRNTALSDKINEALADSDTVKPS